MRALCLDLSTHAGWAVLEGDLPPQDGPPAAAPKLVVSGAFEPPRPLVEELKLTGYPWAYLITANSIAAQAYDLYVKHGAEVIVVEETNLGKNRYAQKMLEFIHAQFAALMDRTAYGVKVVYLSTSAWRKAISLALSKDDRKNNQKLSKAKKHAALYGEKLDKKALGVKGKVGTKHLSVRHVNAVFGLALQMKNNDEADAICLGLAFFAGAETCDGALG